MGMAGGKQLKASKKFLDKHGFLADLHCGSKEGLRPPSWWNKKTPDAIKWMWDRHLIYRDYLKSLKLDALWLVGDLTQGKNLRDGATGLITADMSEQVEMAIECIEEYRGVAPVWFRVGGTVVHETSDGPLKAFDEHFGLKIPPDRQFVEDVELRIGRCLHVSHHPEGKKALYFASMQERTAREAALASMLHGLPDAAFIVHAHYHRKAQTMAYNKMVCAVPCFCLQQPYAQIGGFFSLQPEVGVATLLPSNDERFGFSFEAHCTSVFPPRKATTYAQAAKRTTNVR